MDDLEWMHMLTTLDVCTIPCSIKFCDINGYDVVPLRMVNLRHYESDLESFHLVENEVTISDLSIADESDLPYEQREQRNMKEECSNLGNSDLVLETKLEKIHVFLKSREAIELGITSRDLEQR